MIASAERPIVGVIIPATNTVVEQEFWSRAGHLVEFCTARIEVEDPTIGSDRGEQRLVAGIRAGLDAAIHCLLPTEPEVIVLAVSAASFRDGLRGLREFESELSTLAGTKVVTGAGAVLRSLSDRPQARRVAVLSPYHQSNNREVRRVLEESGYDVTAISGLGATTAQGIASTPQAKVIDDLTDLAGTDPDVVIQLGTNLPTQDIDILAAAHLGRPLLTVNECLLHVALERLQPA